jgi:hypothetical protein
LTGAMTDGDGIEFLTGMPRERSYRSTFVALIRVSGQRPHGDGSESL